jgi:YYY domain-containing protein
LSFPTDRLHPWRPAALDRSRARWVLAGLLLVGAFLRLGGLDWDEGHHLHPDERFISMVEETITAPSGVSSYFDSARSPLNPYNRGHGSFVYGTLPIFLTKAVSSAVGLTGYGGAYKVGRALSALFDLLSVWLVYRLTRRFASRAYGLLAAGLFAFSPLAIQSSHFWTVETFLAAFSLLSLLGCVRIAQGRSTRGQDLATGVAIGLAVACKVTALALVGPLGIAALLRVLGANPAEPGPDEGSARRWARGAAGLLLSALGAVVTIRSFLPYIFRGPSPLSFELDPRYLADIRSLANLSSSFAGFPPALQWADRTPLFAVANFVLWGAGPFFGLAALAALLWAGSTIWKRGRWALAPLVSYVAVLALYHGTTLVKSIRYFFPTYPVLAVLTAVFLFETSARSRSRLVRSAPAWILGGTVLAGIAFSAIYTRPHPRIVASRWILDNVRPPARFANEAWDDGLPFSVKGREAIGYEGPVLEMWHPESAAKVDAIVKCLRTADWIAVTSNRVYANLTRIPDVYPMSVAYYQALFEGRLGFRRAADFTSYPALGALRFRDDTAEEQFTVYDHPRVLLFQKTSEYSEARVRQLLMAAIPHTPPTIWEWEKLPRSERLVTAPVRPDVRHDVERVSTVAADDDIPGSLRSVLVWFLAILALGVLAAPIAFRLFPHMADRGLGLARTIGLVATTFGVSVLVRSGVVANGRTAVWLCLLALGALSSVMAFPVRREIGRFARERARLLVVGEGVFLLGFALFLGLRAMNPEIAWGEKPMDFSILNILVRARTFPTADPWFSGAPLGYYTFGHQSIACLTLLTGLPTRLTFNLAFGLLGGLIAQGAFSLASAWGGRIRAGLAAAAMVTTAGNLDGLREWLVVRRPKGLPLDWHYFWATSRVVKDTINEYPFWSLVFADLHAHVMAMPIFLLVAACALELVRNHAAGDGPLLHRLAAATALGIAIGAQALTNAWDAPFLAGLLLLTALSIVFTSHPFAKSAAEAGRSLANAGLSVTAAIAAAFASAIPLWPSGGSRPGIGWNGEPPASLADVLSVFGLFVFLAFGWWFLATWKDGALSRGLARRVLVGLVAAACLAALALRSADLLAAAGLLAFLVAAWGAERADERLACGFVATGFFLVLFAQRLYLIDRMNTFGKLYLEAWLAFAVATAVLVFGKGRAAVERWPWPARGALVLLAAGSLFTTITAARGAIAHSRPTFTGTGSLPTLDGLAYLEQARPGEAKAVAWAQRSIRGTPVVLEAQGASYQEFGRVSMLTGLPTVLGWEHHVFQRGNPRPEIEARRDAISRIYSGQDLQTVEKLLRRYHVGYVWVGGLERATYPPEGLKKFGAAPALFELAYENRDARVYRVVGGETEGVIQPRREEVVRSEPPRPGPPPDEPEVPPSIVEKGAPDGPPFAGMKEPRAAAVDAKGRIWVTDFGNSRVKVFDRAGTFLGGWGGRGDGPHGLKEPSGISVRGDRLVIADTWNGRVVEFDLKGAWRASAPGLYGPRGIAIGLHGEVWVSDTGNHRVLRFDGLEKPPLSIGKLGDGPDAFSSPVGIAVAPSGVVYVADTGNSRIQVLDAEGRFVARWAVAAWKVALEPQLAAGSDGTLYATDPAHGEVFALDQTGKPLWARSRDDEERPFSRPMGIALDETAGKLWVVNSGTGEVVGLKLARKR